MPTKINGSRAVTPKSRLPTSRVPAKDSPSPTTMPAAASVTPCRTTSFSTSPGSAPRAMRRPSSRVRWLTEYDITP